jgi:hypothetical protein
MWRRRARLRRVDLAEQFDTVLDCGLFHVLDDDKRERYVDSLAAVVPWVVALTCSFSVTTSRVAGDRAG